jgi:putative DNA primase/helicase
MSTNNNLSGMDAGQRPSPSPSVDDVTAGSAAITPPDAALNEDAEIARLAALSPLDYERERTPVAKKLSLRTAILDKLVAARRDRATSADQGRALVLPSPEPWPESVDGALLLSDMTAAILRYVVVEPGAAESVALWVLHAHTLDAFAISPRLAITSPEKNCGKTTLLDVISRLVPRPLATSNTTPAAVFRSIEAAACPTLLIDEADTFLHGKDDLRGILNSGHRRSSAFVMRVVGDDYQPSKFSTWAPTAIAMIGRLPATLEDRSLTVRMRRRRHDETVTRLRADHCPELDELARKAARWAADNIEALRGADPDVPRSLQNRAADNWRPLIAIADAAGGDWPARVRQIAEHTASAAEAVQTDGALLLGDIRNIFAETQSDRLRSADIVAKLTGMEGRPWAGYGTNRPLTPNSLANLLAPFGIGPQTIRIGTGTAKGYLRAQFEDAFNRYLPPATLIEP